MSGNIRNIKIRLNLDKPEARRANEILNSQEKSMSRFVIDAVNAYGSYLDQEKAKLDKRLLVRRELFFQWLDRQTQSEGYGG